MSTNLRISPYIDHFTQRILDDKEQLFSLYRNDLQTYNIVFPHTARTSLDEFNLVFKEKKIRGYVQYAHKPNKSKSIVAEFAKDDTAHIDVASFGELQSALSCGFSSDRICATGPKNDRFLHACIDEKIEINIDSLLELSTVISYQRKKSSNSLLSVSLRVNIESLLQYNKEGRFGILKKDIDTACQLLLQNKDVIDFVGFSFHANFDSKKLRPLLFEKILSLHIEAHKKGLSPRNINVGGGFRINYVADPKEWFAYTEEIKKSALGQHDPLGWEQSSFGYWSEEGVLRGAPQFMDLYEKDTPQDQLRQFFDTYLHAYEMTVADACREFMVCLVIEPGRALLASAGMTVTSIIDVKESSLGNNVIITNMNRSQLAVSDMTYMIDPILISQKPHSKNQPYTAFVAGTLCLDSDIICRHKVHFDRVPHVGDLLCFVNTAGYYMDFTESQTLQHSTAKKYIAIEQNGLKIVQE